METNTTALVRMESGAVQHANAYTAADVLQQVGLIQDVMRAAMKDGEHYGTIPGCGDKKTLKKPGAEKLGLTFRLAPEYQVETKDLPNGHREHRIICRLVHIASGLSWGQGVGSCTSMESKYRFRMEDTGRPVPQRYWDTRDKSLLGGERFVPKKKDGKWTIQERVEHDNPADYFNTVLKIAKKRAHVDAILTATAASDIFTQDAEDIRENLAAFEADETNVEPRHETDAQRETPPPRPPAASTTSAAVDPNDWRGIKLHFGKNKGLSLGQMKEPLLEWYIQNWQPKEWNGRISDEDKTLRAGLDAAAAEMERSPL
jgi:hypothetical protein